MEGTNGTSIRCVSLFLIPAISVCVCVPVAGGCFGADAIGGCESRVLCCLGWSVWVCLL